MKNHYGYRYIIVGVVVLAIGFVVPVSAETIINNNNSSVTNNISVKSSNGGEVYINGELVETGENKAEVSIYTEVNGEVVQDINKEIIDDSEDVSIQIDSKVEVSDDETKVKTEVISNDEEVVKEEFLSKNDDVMVEANDTSKESLDDNQVEKVNIDDNADIDDIQKKVDLDFWQFFINFFKNIFSFF